MSEEFRVRELGGYAAPIDISTVLIGVGTGSMLDAYLPDNYSRSRLQDTYYNLTALVPLAPLENYFQSYFNMYGEQKPAVRENFATDSPDVNYRLFGQGYVFKVRYIRAFTAPSSRDYKSYRTVCNISGCCGPMGQSPMQGCNCNADTCTYPFDGCSDDEGCADQCLDDGRNFVIVQGSDSIVDSTPPLAGGSNNAPLNLRIARRPQLRGWEPLKVEKNFGKNVYNM
jgi:hypothetical protein